MVYVVTVIATGKVGAFSLTREGAEKWISDCCEHFMDRPEDFIIRAHKLV